MKRALTIGAVAALVIGVTLPAAAFEPNLDVSVAYADAALPGDPLSPQSSDVAEGAVSASVKDAFSADAGRRGRDHLLRRWRLRLDGCWARCRTASAGS